MDSNARLLAVTVVLYLIIVVLGFPQAVGIGLAVVSANLYKVFIKISDEGEKTDCQWERREMQLQCMVKCLCGLPRPHFFPAMPLLFDWNVLLYL